MARIAIVEDDAECREQLRDYVEHYGRENREELEVVCFSDGAELVEGYRPVYDLLLLDIEMPDLDGMTAARRIRQVDSDVLIVFITNMAKYAISGYEVEALHYLMKPVDESKLFSVLDRAADKLCRNEQFLTLELSGETVRLPVYQIRYAEVQGNYVTVHAKSDYTAKMTLSELETRLDDSFFRLGRSALVNLGYVARVTKTAVTLNDGSVLPLPRGAYDRINRAIINRG